MLNRKSIIKKVITFTIIFTLLLTQFSTGIQAAVDNSLSKVSQKVELVKEDREKTEVIVKYKDSSKSSDSKSDVKTTLKLEKFEEKAEIKEKNIKIYTISEKDDMDKVVKELKKDSNVEYVQPNYKLTMFDIVNPFEQSIYDLGDSSSGWYTPYDATINLNESWSLTKGSNTLVGVLDTGMDILHEDLFSNIYVNTSEIPNNGIDDDFNGYIDDVNGWDFANNDNNVNDTDAEYHATHIAGTIAAMDNGLEITGVAPETKIVPLKFIDGEIGYTSDAIAAIEYAQSIGVDVINCSWGSSALNQALLDTMARSNILFVCAAGNDGTTQVAYPAAYNLSNVISVGSISQQENVSDFSNYGSGVDLFAPGEAVVSTTPGNNYGMASGTSMASPFVAATAALIKSNNSSLYSNQIKDLILNNVRTSDYLNIYCATSGKLDVYSSLINLSGFVTEKDYGVITLDDINTILNSVSLFTMATTQEQEIITEYYEITAQDIISAQSLGYNLQDAINIAVCLSKSTFTITQVTSLLSSEYSTDMLKIEVLAYENFINKYMITATEKSSLNALFVAGNTADAIHDAYVINEVTNSTSINSFLRLDTVVVLDTLLEDMMLYYEPTPYATLVSIFEKYDVNKETLLQYFIDNNSHPFIVDKSIEEYESNKYSQYAAAIGIDINLSATEEELKFDKYFTAPRILDTSGDYNPTTGQVQSSNTDIVLQGINGLDVMIRSKYNQSDAALKSVYSWTNIEHSYYVTQIYQDIQKWRDTGEVKYTGNQITINHNVFWYEEALSLENQMNYSNQSVGSGVSSSGGVYRIYDIYRTSQATMNVANFNVPRLYDAEDSDIVNDEIGIGWSFNFPSITTDTVNNVTSKYLHTSDGGTYTVDITTATTDSNLYDYKLLDMIFNTDSSSFTNGIVSSSYVLEYKNGIKEYFASDGRYIGKEDRYGNKIKVQNTLFDGHYVVTKVIDTMSREININYQNITGGRTVTLTGPDNSTVVYNLSEITGYSGKYKLVSRVDQENRTTTYTYNKQNVNYSFFSETERDKNYDVMILNQINYDNGVTTNYTFESLIARKGGAGAEEFYRLSERKDTYNSIEYNKMNFTYVSHYNGTLSWFQIASNLPSTYTYKVAVTDDKLIKTTTYNYKHLPVDVTITDKNSNNISKTINTYDNTYKQLTISETRNYNSSGQYMKNVQNYEYDSNHYGDMTGSWGALASRDTSNVPTSDEHKLATTYNSTYHYPTQVEYKKDSNTTIRQTYTPTSSGKDIEYSQTYEIIGTNSPVLRDKTQYVYDNYGNVTEERKYLEGDTSAWNTYYSTFYDYSDNVTSRNGQFNGGFITRTYVTGIKDVDNALVSARAGINAGIIDSRFEYDINGRTVKSYDGMGYLTQYQYDDLGRVTIQTNPNNTSVSISYNDTLNETTVLDANSNTFKMKYNGFGLPTQLVDTLTSELLINKEYNNLLQLVKETTNSNQTVIEYDYQDNGKQLETSIYNRYGKLEAKESYTYDEAYNSGQYYKTITTTLGDANSPDNKSVTYYDETGNTVKTGYIENSTEYLAEFTHDYLGNILQTKSIRHIDENWTEAFTEKYEYDFANRIVKAYNVNGDFASTEYDSLGRKISITDILGNKATTPYHSTFEYDEIGRMIKQTVPFENENSTIYYSESLSYYDRNGNVISAKTKNNEAGTTDTFKLSEYIYDNLNRLTTVKAYSTLTSAIYSQYYYDNVGNVLRTYTGLSSPLTISGLDTVSGTDTDYSVMKFEYDRFSNMTKRTDPMGQDEVFTYDYNSNLTQVTDRNGNVINYEYDGVSKLLSQQVSNSTNSNAESIKINRYTQLGLIDMSYSDGYVSEYDYNSRGLITSESTSDNVLKEYMYDAIGNQTNLTLKVNNITKSDIDYEYDKLNRMQYVKEGIVTKATYQYDDNGNRSTLTYDNGNNTTYSYNLSNVITNLTNKVGSTIQSCFDYTYSLDGNRVSEANTASNKSKEYSYDKLGRLTIEIHKLNSTTTDSYIYSYDDNSNRLTKSTLNGTVTSYSYDDNNRLLLEAEVSTTETNNTIYKYDNNGNQIATTQETIQNSNSSTPGVSFTIIGDDTLSNATYNIYNGFNELVGARNKGYDASYGYNGAGLRISKTVNDIESRQIYSGMNIIFETQGANEVQYTRGINLISSNNGTSESYYSFNGHGDVVNLTSNVGIITKTYEYDAFGNEKNIDSNDSNPFRYCGEYFDKETGSIYLRARYYNPSIGRFISQDSYYGNNLDPLSLNLYIYCVNNPIILVDMTGNSPMVDILIDGEFEITSNGPKPQYVSPYNLSYNPSYYNDAEEYGYYGRQYRINCYGTLLNLSVPDAETAKDIKSDINNYAENFQSFVDPVSGTYVSIMGMIAGSFSGNGTITKYVNINLFKNGLSMNEKKILKASYKTLFDRDRNVHGKTINFITRNQETQEGYYKGAILIDSNGSEHYLRQNEDGTWMHKNGGGEAKNTDFNGNVIYDPQTADFGDFNFLGYLEVSQ